MQFPREIFYYYLTGTMAMMVKCSFEHFTWKCFRLKHSDNHQQFNRQQTDLQVQTLRPQCRPAAKMCQSITDMYRYL